jgi:hypothetical protein
VKFQKAVSFLGPTKKNVAHTAMREWSILLRMTIGSALGRGLAPFASSSILNENRMMDSDLTEAYFIWHDLLATGSAESGISFNNLASGASPLWPISAFSP